MASNKEIGKKYQLLDEIEHVIKRPGMYIGSTKPHTSNEWILEDGAYQKYELTYNPGFLKLFDEIISNSVDEHKRSGKINTIKVTTTSDTITVWDNGGIPVVQHPDHKVWIPELIFSNLRAGSNFNDEEARTVAGTNGVGASLVNIFSKKFIIDTADGKNRLLQTFTNNMANRTPAKISRSSQGFTEITYVPDLARFEMTDINTSNWKMMRKRVIDIAAANPGLKLEFNGEKFKFKTFKEYVDLYVKDSIWERSKDWEFAMGVSKDGYQSISFVNSIGTKDSGTHEAYILNQVVDYLRTMIKKKHKVEVKPSEIKNHIFLFINCTVLNPAFSSQTKEKLITEPKDFGTQHTVTEKFAKAVFTSEVIQSLLDWIEQKKNADERAELRKLNKSLGNTKVLKLIDAKGKDRNKCVLGIFEGMCLSEDTKIKIIKNGMLVDDIISNAMIGDLVITHNNSFREIYQISKKIGKSIKIKLKNGQEIVSTKDHRFFIFDSTAQSFSFVKVSNLDLTRHKFVKNRLSNIDSFYEILEVTKIENKSDKFNYEIILADHPSIFATDHLKLCVLNKRSMSIAMVDVLDIDPTNHLYVGLSSL